MKLLLSGLACWLLVPLFAYIVNAQNTPAINSPDTSLLQALKSSNNDTSRISLLLSSHIGEVDESLWQRVVELGINHREARDFALAYFYFAAAQQIAQSLSNQQLEGLAWYQTGLTDTAQAEVEAAIQHYLQSRALLMSAEANAPLVYVLADLGALYLYQQNYVKCKDYSAQSLACAALLPASELAASSRPDGVGIAWLNLGEAAHGEDDHPQALACLHQALSHFQNLAQNNPRWRNEVSEALAEIGRIYRTQGNYLAALSYLNQALALIRTLPARNQQADTLKSIGVLHLEQENYEPATTAFQEALALYRQIQDADGIAAILFNLAIIEQRQQHFAAAMTAFQEAESAGRTVNNQDVVLAAREGQGAILTVQGRHTDAQSILENALVQARAIRYRYREAEILWRLAQNYSATGDFPNTIAFARQARDLAQQIQYAKLLCAANTTLGQGFLGLADKVQARTAFQAAVETIEELRQHLSNGPAGSQIFLANRTAPYQALAVLALEQHDHWDALNWMERAKARVLFDLVWQAENLGHVGTGPAKTPLHTAWPTLDENNVHLLWRLEPHTAYLSYLVTPGETYLFVLTSDADAPPVLRVIPLHYSQVTLTDQVQQFQEMLATRQPSFSPLAQALYDKLVLPARPFLPQGIRLGLAPDGPLWSLPFQALLSSPTRYLLDDYPLFYTPSLNFLAAISHPSVIPHPPVSLLALGNPAGKAKSPTALRHTPGALPDASREVQSLAAWLDPGSHSQVLVGAQATESAFKQLAPQFQILHLATHGVVNQQRPLHSYLTLAASAEPEPAEDGRLEAWEAMALPLQADLAILSACETGAGKLAAGEGVISLSWAFLVAGSRNVIASRWAVNSSSTARMMTRFYQARRQQSLPSAWRTAALSLRTDQRYAHPHYWAGVDILGAN